MGKGVKPQMEATWFLQVVDGAGDRHGAAVLRHHGGVRRAVVIGDEVLRLVVTFRMRRVICDLLTDVVGKVI